jgi:phage terminase large subunit
MNVTVEANEVFRPVHESRKRYVAMRGSAGSGKSVDTAQQYILRLMQDRGRNLACIRKKRVHEPGSTFAELVGAINRMGVGAVWQPVMNPLEIRCGNGNRIIFRGMNDFKQREKLKSITFPVGKLTDVWAEEATELLQDDFEIIDDRLRGELPEGLFYQIKLSFNPVNKNHWIKRVFFDAPDADTLAHKSTYLDNRFIDAAYRRRMMRRKRIDPAGFLIYGLGEWGETGGLILKNWEAEEISQNLQDYDDIALGQDFGFNHANAILLLGWRDAEVYILREIYVHELDTTEIIPLAVKAGLPRGKRMWCDSAEPDRIAMWQKAGYNAKAVSKEQNSVHAQIDWLRGVKIHVHPSCVNAIKELQQWKYAKDEKTGQYTDEPVKIMDDAMAALRYGVEGWRKPKIWMY